MIASVGGPRRVADIYPLSPLQRGLLFHSLYEPDAAVYVISLACRLQGALDADAFEQAWKLAIARHAVLRTAFVGHDLDVPLQVVLREAALRFDCEDWRHLPAAEQDRRFAELQQAERSRGFDFAQPPLMRLSLIRIGDHDHRLLWNVHHIVLDGWSIPLLLDDVLTAYAALSRHETPKLSPLRPFKDYIGWLQRQDLARAEAHWRRRLAGFDTPSSLTLARPSGDERHGERHGELHHTPKVDFAAVERFAREHKLTMNTLVQGAWALLLGRYCGSDDVVFGVTLSGRPAELPDVERTVGLFVNTLPLRVGLSDAATVLEWLRVIQARQSELTEYQYSPLPLVQRWSEVADGTALFESIVAYENYPVAMSATTGISEQLRISDACTTERTSYPLTLQVTVDTSVTFKLIYDAERFAATALERMLGHLGHLLGEIVADPARQLGSIPLLSGAERQEVVSAFNATAMSYPQGLLHELIEAQARRTPEAIALRFEGETLGYDGLERQANQLARQLQSRGVGPDVVVGICAERSLEMVIGLLGILKAGGAYLPLDPSLPPERLAIMLEDAGARVLLAQDALTARLPASDAVVVQFKADAAAIAGYPDSAPVVACTPDNLAYVIYTSGSTGRPKGVMNSHRGIVNRLAWMQDAYRLRPEDVVMQKTPFGFDVSVWEFFWPLMQGAELVIARPGGHQDPAYLSELIERHSVTVMHFVPSMLQAFLETAELGRCGSLRDVICSGEALPAETQTRFLTALASRLHNLYGPTEAAVDVSAWACRLEPEATQVPIGRPISNIQLYVLDPRLEPVPIGVAGELYISGVGLARGYLHRPSLTAERFVPSPFARGERLYRTGDLARWRADGALDYLGRLDHQVKLRGFRIELGEIEAALTAQIGVAQAAVVLREDAGGKRLVGYVVVQPGAAIDVETLRGRLQRTLPDYMVPSAIVMLAALPLTPNGKLDRNALPAPEFGSTDIDAAPRNAAETILASIFMDVLGVEHVGIHDDFFACGGHSLLATQVVARAQRELSVQVPLRVLFEAPTVAGLAARLSLAPESTVAPLLPVPRQQPLPLSHGQERLWFVEQLGLSGSSYLVTAAVRLVGKLDADALSAALSDVVRRHESLRTRFEVRGESAMQVIDPPWPVALAPEMVATEDEARQRADALMRQPFDLSRDRLLRVALLQMSPDVHVLVLSMHHIVSDGWSMGVLLGEVETLYAAFCTGRPSPLPDLPIQYADYAVWQRRWLEETALQRQLDYWTTQLAGAPVGIELATDRPRPAVPSLRGAVHRFSVESTCTAALTALARQEGATLFMVLLAAYDVLLSRWSGQDDVVVGTPVAGRSRIETERLIGFFVNMLALRCDVSGTGSFRDVLRQIKATALDAYAHQDLPFEKLVEALHPVRDLSREPVFQIVFALQNTPQRSRGLPGLKLEPFAADAVAAKFDLELAMTEEQGALSATLVYATDLFDAETIARLAEHFVRLLQGIAANPDGRLSELSLLSAAERQQLVAWNGSSAVYAQDRCLHELFAEQAERDPAAVALVMDDEELSYGALERRANQLAHHLQSLGVGPDVIVGLCVERSLDMVVGVLGILKAGGAYLPLDPRYPAERLAYMVDDARVNVLVTQAALLERLPATDTTLVRLDADAAAIAAHPDIAPVTACDADHLAYVIYTSGSTGRPKGVMTSHRGIMNLADAQLGQLPLQASDRILQFASISFDAAVWDLVMSWRVGAALVLAAQHDLMPGEPLREVLQRQRVTAVLLPPAALAALPVALLPELKVLIAGGEACTAELLRPWLAGRSVFNAYGPTEASVCTTMARCGDERRPPIGRALPNTRVYLLDARLEPVPIGVAGELYIGGVGLARGYLHRPSLTAERFVPSPFARGERLYRTGDLARWRADGALDYLGRLDHQVKLRGFRIELGEIEAALSAQTGIAQAAVVLREDGGGKRLVGYVVAQPETQLDVESLRQQLQRSLPDYMVPSAIVALASLPLTPNGKLDRNALPAPDRRRDGADQPPRNPVETVLAGLFADVLNLERVGIHDNFFELGGHSLLAMQLLERIRATLGIALPVRLIFMAPTIAGLAEHAEQALASEIETMTPAEIEIALQDLDRIELQSIESVS
ncbi:amino acid adenylation domain protein [Bradyrhizobium oligotrophicum S58]|uniref:Amino acid adenylation domain protein n=1 Tax=Bradyrhizobium oligotrophicum S58 TaxID=1245469 RepID=M4Z6C3_9BRAD|nr:amino acid adenylation domain protein [Bradyrhizobium oligotrophicum S58]